MTNSIFDKTKALLSQIGENGSIPVIGAGSAAEAEAMVRMLSLLIMFSLDKDTCFKKTKDVEEFREIFAFLDNPSYDGRVIFSQEKKQVYVDFPIVANVKSMQANLDRLKRYLTSYAAGYLKKMPNPESYILNSEDCLGRHIVPPLKISSYDTVISNLMISLLDYHGISHPQDKEYTRMGKNTDGYYFAVEKSAYKALMRAEGLEHSRHMC